MKPFWKDVWIAITMGLVVPCLMLAAALRLSPPQEDVLPQPVVTEVLPVQEPAKTLQILVKTADGTPEEMELETYLTGALLAEVPASFHMEALKAQAVVARTYTIRAHFGHSKHSDADVCVDSGCCQAYIAPQDYLEKGGKQEGIDRICTALSDTRGQVLCYEGELIEATYFSCSGGSTEDAVAVWGTDVPYLRATDSPGEENASHFTDSVTMPHAEFAQRLGLTPAEDPPTWLGPVYHTAGGGVDSIEICGQVFGGTQVRKLLGLRSTMFAIDISPDDVTITTHGYGHRVGMSQYGADAMAESGAEYTEILTHYYQGTQLAPWLVDKEPEVG